MKKIILFISVIYFQPQQSCAQDSLYHNSGSLISSLVQGHFQGQLRYNFISADNANFEGDSYAHAAGISLQYKTLSFHHFNFTIGGAIVQKIASGHLVQTENTKYTRYEITLLNVQDPLQKTMGRMEELNIGYSNKGFKALMGRQILQSTFINPEDSRMRPTMTEGLWMELKKTNYHLEGGWITRIAPRSIYQWHGVDRSIGLYPQGVNINGTAGAYAGNLDSRGIAVAGVQYVVNKNVSIKILDQWVENIFNTAMIQVHAERKKGHAEWFAAGQLIHQNALNSGGNNDMSKTYFAPKEKSLVFGFKTGMKNSKTEISINYTRITAKGRYLMPREWGKDPFFTFIPRERNEGGGGVHALAAIASSLHSKSFRSSIALGYYSFPAVENFRLNKYGMPSYFHFNYELKYSLDKKLETALLFVYKGLAPGESLAEKYVFNKVNMALYHLAVNYNF